MKNKILNAATFIYLGIGGVAWASDEHSHEEEASHESDDHAEKESSIVGPDKGILAATTEGGIKLSPEATKNFGLQTAALNGSGPWLLPHSAIVYSGRETNLYRFREGFYKRIDFAVLSKDPNSIRVSSPDLKGGDSIVTRGLGLLRVAEIAAFGGAPEGHSH